MGQSANSSRFASALRFLSDRIDYERCGAVTYGSQEFHLGRMQDLLAGLGHPEKRLRIVHVAGSKGKGSTAAMIASVLTAAGYRTGLYSSPHLDRVEERLAIDSQPCSPDDFVHLVDAVRPVVDQLDRQGDPSRRPTYFDIVTALALQHFAEQAVDVAVLEVGMGGRLDSTNVCQPDVAVITSISRDHTQQLGDTLTEIAGEKCGIIKPGTPVISGVQEEEPAAVITEVSRQHDCPLYRIGVDFDAKYHPPKNLHQADSQPTIDLWLKRPAPERHYEKLSLGLLGAHQAQNAAVAAATLGVLRDQGWKISDQDLTRGLQNVRWPARIEVIGRAPTVILDAAHNEASIAALCQVLEESLPPATRRLVFATTQGKDVEAMLRILLPRFDEVIYTRYKNNPRAVPPEQLAAIGATIADTPQNTTDSPRQAWQHITERATRDQLIVVAGSFFIAGEMRTEIEKHPLPHPLPRPLSQPTNLAQPSTG